MKTFYIMWTYIANYSSKPIQIMAASPELAVEQVKDMYSKDFGDKATIFVFESPPVHVYKGPVPVAKGW